ncbi:MAG: hypothetical protein JWO39_1160 [Gemmatimonadetes bacterium]|jgi:hypothetical protein|nr:hypothetical protein [Gemmatimonadota bacterium]
MYRTMSMLGAVAAMAVLACSPTDRKFITGTNEFTSVAVALDPASATVAEGDSAALTTTVTLVPQGTVVPNGSLNVQYAFSNPDVAHINDSGFIQGDAAGTTTLTATYTDPSHNFATTTSNVVTITVDAP